MKKFLVTALIALQSCFPNMANAIDVKISQLPLGSASGVGVNDSFPYVAASVGITRRLTLWDLINLPPMVSTYAPKANPIFTGTVTAPTFVGALTGNSSTATALAANPTDCALNTFANTIAANGNLTCSAVGDAALSVSYLKADGTRALTGNWAAGAFSATHNSVVVGSAANTISGLSTTINGSGTTAHNSIGTITLPNATDTLVGKATTDTLTNKTIGASTNAIDAGAITTGTIATARGGTNANSSASTGVAKVSSGTWSFATIVNADISSSAAIATSKIALNVPTVQKFTSGSGTYTTPAGVLYIHVRAVGGGGGGGGSGTTTTAGAGGNGGDTTFGTTLIVAGGGTGGGKGGNPGGGGGSASLGSGPIGVAIIGAAGGGGGTNSTTAVSLLGGSGGNAPFFSGGGAASSGGFAGSAGTTNTGGGGGGCGTASGTNTNSGGGGGSGGFVDAIITAPAGTYAYGVGASGTAGTVGSGTGVAAGGAGAAGQIVVEEFYQ